MLRAKHDMLGGDLEGADPGEDTITLGEGTLGEGTLGEGEHDTRHGRVRFGPLPERPLPEREVRFMSAQASIP